MDQPDTVSASATSSDPPFFTLDLSPRYPVKSFARFADLKAWLNDENDFFSFLADNPQMRGSPFTDIAGQSGIFKYALEQTKQIDDAGERAEIVANHLRKMHAQFRAAFVDQQCCLVSDDPRASFISRMWESDPDKKIAGWALYFFIARQFGANMNDPRVFEGAVRAVLFNRGIQDRSKGETAALAKLNTQYRSHIDELELKRRDLVSATEASTAAGAESATQRAKEFSDAQESRADEFAKLRSEWQATIEQQHKAFNEHLALKAPVTYWRSKARNHAVWGAVFAGSSVLFLWLYIWAVVEALPSFIGMLRGVVSAASGATAQDSHAQAVPVYVALFAVALIGIWLMRILVRLTLSHIHLGTDAKHRSVCVESYLALLSMKEEAIGKDERKIILTQLFRPTSDGLVRDDAMPPTLIERLTK
jgi:hypothetical protein